MESDILIFPLAKKCERCTKFVSKFIAGGEDMWVHVFDFHTGEEIGCHKGHHGPVHCVRFSPGGESYSSGSEEGIIRIWQTGKAKVGATDEVAHKMEDIHIVGERTGEEDDV